MPHSSRCPFCARHFSVMLWRHECDACKSTVCDDCAPKSNGRRVCCGCVANKNKLPTTAKKGEHEKEVVSPTSAAAEREKRIQAAEERMRAAQQRGRPQKRDVQSPAMEPPKGVSEKQDCTHETPQQRERENNKGGEKALATAPPARANGEENPVLAAALRRQQEQESRNTVRGNTTEKTRLVNEIIMTLRQRGEEEPFGLRAMDETKLQSYLRYIKSK